MKKTSVIFFTEVYFYAIDMTFREPSFTELFQ